MPAAAIPPLRDRPEALFRPRQTEFLPVPAGAFSCRRRRQNDRSSRRPESRDGREWQAEKDCSPSRNPPPGPRVENRPFPPDPNRHRLSRGGCRAFPLTPAPRISSTRINSATIDPRAVLSQGTNQPSDDPDRRIFCAAFSRQRENPGGFSGSSFPCPEDKSFPAGPAFRPPSTPIRFRRLPPSGFDNT